MGKEEKRMNDEKEYRKRIRQEKEKLQEVEIFTSVKFVRLLKSISSFRRGHGAVPAVDAGNRT